MHEQNSPDPYAILSPQIFRKNLMPLAERIQLIKPERILWCCTDYGIAPGDLARELDISPTTIEKVLSGEIGLTFNQLRKMAEYFGRGVLFFLEEGQVNETQVHTPQFRTLANQKPELSARIKALIERVEKQRDVYLSLREDLDDTDRPLFGPPDLSQKNPGEAAHAVRQWLGLGDRNTFETYREAVEAQGVLVFRSNGYNGKWQIAKESPILGFTLYDVHCPVIVVKKQSRESRRLRSCMNWGICFCTRQVRSTMNRTSSPTRAGNERQMHLQVICWCRMIFWRVSATKTALMTSPGMTNGLSDPVRTGG
jgi:transcriptional regulator with XRE-family HTH domain